MDRERLDFGDPEEVNIWISIVWIIHILEHARLTLSCWFFICYSLSILFYRRVKVP
jgi:hypothetical protein